MKRSLQSEPHLLPLKRRNSSLFSISTVLEDDERRCEEELLVLPSRPPLESRISTKLSCEKNAVPYILKHSQSVIHCHLPFPQRTDPTTSEEYGSCREDDGGFFIGGDLSPPASPLQSPIVMAIDEINESTTSDTIQSSEDTDESGESAVESEPVLSAAGDTKSSSCSGCCRTGIVHEDASRHFDYQNRYHKERPIRVTSIMQALQSNGILSRCRTILPQTENALSPSAVEFLNDEDYLRVHLPGYMQR